MDGGLGVMGHQDWLEAPYGAAGMGGERLEYWVEMFARGAHGDADSGVSFEAWIDDESCWLGAFEMWLADVDDNL